MRYLNRRVPAARLAFLILLTTVAPALARPGPDAPAPRPQDAMPPLAGGAPAAAPPFAAQNDARGATPGTTGAPAIHVWYGLDQRAGHRGDPQKWFNIPGNVASAAPLASLTYSLNDGPARALAVGPDDLRLARAGDFNVEVDYTDLRPGPNAVLITATDANGATASVAIAVDYQGGAALPPGTYIYDWSPARRVDDVAQIVDGHWALDGGGIRPTIFDFDRLLALGDLSWRDYTVSVPITIFSIDPEGYKAPSNGPGVGVMVRWQGHYDAGNGVQPVTGWRRLGALAWYRWQKQSGVYTEGLQLLGHQGRVLATSARKLNTGVTYIFKVAIQSGSNPTAPAIYRFKVWRADQAEPAAWDFEQRGVSGEPSGGSILLLAHHVDARFGTVQVDLASSRPQPALALSQDGAGELSATPPGPTYRFGEDVVVAATPGPGSSFTGWSGAATGTANPLHLTLFESTTLTAGFSAGGNGLAVPLLLSSAGSGTAGSVAFAPADALRYAGGRWTMHYDGSALDANRNVTALARDGDTLLLAFASAQTTPAGAFTPWDVVRFTPVISGDFSSGVFSLALRGSTAGLSTSGEKIDALDVLDDGHLLISTTGTAAVALPDGTTLKAQDEDVLVYDPRTARWGLAFNGTAIPKMGVEDVNGLWQDEATGDLYLTLLGAFSVGRPAVSGSGRTILRLRPDAAALGGYTVVVAWNAADAGLPTAIDAIDLDEE